MPGGRSPRNTWPIVVGQAVSLLGDYIAVLALPLFVLELTGSALDLGLTTAFETLPVLLFGFAAGVALDRFAIKRALIIADLGRAGAFAALGVAVATWTALFSPKLASGLPPVTCLLKTSTATEAAPPIQTSRFVFRW